VARMPPACSTLLHGHCGEHHARHESDLGIGGARPDGQRLWHGSGEFHVSVREGQERKWPCGVARTPRVTSTTACPLLPQRDPIYNPSPVEDKMKLATVAKHTPCPYLLGRSGLWPRLGQVVNEWERP